MEGQVDFDVPSEVACRAGMAPYTRINSSADSSLRRQAASLAAPGSIVRRTSAMWLSAVGAGREAILQRIMTDPDARLPALRMANIEMWFGRVHALRNINLEVGRNEVVGLVGDNGAGKSTVVKILTGVFAPTAGSVSVNGHSIDFDKYSVKEARRLGVETVYQDRSLAEKQVLWRNFFVGREISGRFGFIDVKKEKEVAQHIMINRIGFRGVGITVDSTVSKLSGGERQGVSIGRAMHFEANLVILDEPTVALSLKEVNRVLTFVRQIREAGKACVYISHNIAEVYAISDRFIIMDRGEIVTSINKQDTSLKDINEFLLRYAHSTTRDGETGRSTVNGENSC